MRKDILLTLLALSCFSVHGQELSDNVRAVYDVCVSLSDAAGSGSAPAMREANARLKEMRAGYFSSFRFVSGESMSIDGHFIFDPEFIDSLLVNRKVYSFAQSYLERSVRRGTSSSCKVLMKTCCVKAFQTVTYKFKARGRQELAVVTEPGGLVNLKIYDVNNDMWHNDDNDVNMGKPSHVRVFDIPEGLTDIVVEVVNKTDRDISFVVISNV